MELFVDHGSIEIFQAIPADLSQFRIPGAHEQFVLTDFLKMFVRAFPGPGYVAALTDYLTHEKGGMRAKQNKPLLEFRCAMENQLTGTWDGIKDPGLMPWYFNFSYTPGVQTHAHFKKDSRYRVFDIHIERDFFELFKIEHPILGKFLQQVDSEHPVQLSEYSFPCSWRMRRAITEIIKSPYHPAFRQQMQDTLIKTILVNALQVALFQKGSDPITLLPHQEESLREAKRLIEENTGSPLTNKEICKAVNLTPETLRLGFRKMFSTTPYNYHIDLKFREAECELTETCLSISEVALRAGYTHPGSFIREFKKRYGFTPMDFREEFGSSRLMFLG